MTSTAQRPDDNAARVLALIAVANGRVKDCELQTLEELEAFTRLGVSRRRFLQLAQRGLDDVGERLSERGRLHLADLLYLDHLLDGVRDRQQRLLVCRLAAAVITADGQVTPGERNAYDHMLARWRLDAPTVAEAIRADMLQRARLLH